MDGAEQRRAVRPWGACVALGDDVDVGVDVPALRDRADAAGGQEGDQLLDGGRQALAVDDPPGGGAWQRLAPGGEAGVAQGGSTGPFVRRRQGEAELALGPDELEGRRLELGEFAALRGAATDE
ncbi:hypothetical protein [Streptomyces sp. NPDC008122]|uniref:hypothetical protein n=1 Tax=Streptomyces sp. NPDC008122 TaxID=3364810 RepID=UPI0036E088A0